MNEKFLSRWHKRARQHLGRYSRPLQVELRRLHQEHRRPERRNPDFKRRRHRKERSRLLRSKLKKIFGGKVSSDHRTLTYFVDGNITVLPTV